MNGILMLLAEEGGANLFDFNVWNMLIYLANFVILFVGLYLLLFRPVKKFMAKRNENILKVTEENERLSKEVQGMKAEYDTLVSDAKQELAKANEQAKIIAQKRSDEILAEANERAKAIVRNAKEEIENEKRRAETMMKGQVAEISVEIAKKIIGREISPEINSALIEDSLRKWEDENGQN